MFGGKYEIFMFEYKFYDIQALKFAGKKLKLELNQIKNFVTQYKLKTLSEEEKGL